MIETPSSSTIYSYIHEQGGPASPKMSGAVPATPSLSPVRRFQLVSLLVLLLGMFCTGWWLGQQIEERVIWHTVSINAAYVESVVTPLLHHLRQGQPLGQGDITALDQHFTHAPLKAQVAALVVWDRSGNVLYSSDTTLIGQTFPPDAPLLDAFSGRVTWQLNDRADKNHISIHHQDHALLGIYSPVHDERTGQVIAVVEYYQSFNGLLDDIALAQEETWLIIGGATLIMYLLLAGFIQRTSDTVVRQEGELRDKVAQLTDLLAQNGMLYARTQRATQRAATLHERILRHVSADLHDGPAQYLGAAVLHLDRIVAYHQERPDPRMDPFVTRAQQSLARAVSEVRNIAAGLGVPQIDGLSPSQLVAYVVASHEQATHSTVALTLGELPTQLGPSTKVTLYRVIQEALNNAYRHGGGIAQQVAIAVQGDALVVVVGDGGPGFCADALDEAGEHMGLVGMRDRVESLGGSWSIESAPGCGTRLTVRLALNEAPTLA